MEKWKCNFCGQEKEVKNKYTKSGHLAKCNKWKDFKLNKLTKDFLYEEYVVKGRSAIDIAKEIGLSSAIAIIKRLKELDIKTRNISESNNDIAIAKREKTCNERFGCRNVWARNSPYVKKYLEKEKVKNPFQIEDVKNKIKETNISKYGVPFASQNKDIKEKIKNTTFQRYGVFHNSQSDEIKKRKVETCLKNYGVPYGGFVCGKTLTKPHKKLIEILNDLKIFHKIEQHIQPYVVDILIDKRVIEIYGCYWHCSPKKYKENDIIAFPSQGKIYVKEIWERDKFRINYIKSKGYDVLILWEDELQDIKMIKEKICLFLKLNQ